LLLLNRYNTIIMANYSQAELQSKTIEFLRFPLIIAVMFAHAVTSATFQDGYVNSGGGYFWYDNIRYLISNIFGYVTVPTLFFISGFLFFGNIKIWSLDKYGSKLKTRIKSLLIPYLFWNAFAIAIVIVAYSGMSSLTPGKAGEHFYSVKNIIGMFWNYGQTGNPAQIPLWYVRNLMVIDLLAPVVWLWVTNLRQWGVIFLGLLWVSNIVGSVWNIDETIFLFTFGAYFGINKLDMVVDFNKLFKFSVIAFPIMALADVCTQNQVFNIYIHRTAIFLGIVFVFNIVSHGINNRGWHISSSLIASNFFLYSSHYYILSFIRRGMIYTIRPDTEGAHFIVYFVPVLLAFCLIFAVFLLMKKVTPRFLGIICGGRA